MSEKSEGEYSLTLKINYETKFGESLCVVGSIPELGEWKHFKAHLTWSPGHTWVMKAPLVTNTPIFNYKYLVLKDKKGVSRWEKCTNRVADLKALSKSQKSPHVEIEDKWEIFKLKISILDLMPSQTHSLTVEVEGPGQFNAR